MEIPNSINTSGITMQKYTDWYYYARVLGNIFSTGLYSLQIPVSYYSD
jgi:hypothetical protein